MSYRLFGSLSQTTYIVASIAAWSVLSAIVAWPLASARGRSPWRWSAACIPFGWFAVVALVLLGQNESPRT